MRRLLSLLSVLVLFPSLFAAAQNAPATTVGPQEVQALRSELAEQREQIRQLRALVEQFVKMKQAAEASTASAPATQAAPAPAAPQAQNTYSTSEKQIAKLQSISDRFRAGGDIRLRFEPAWQETVPARYRTMLRVRMGVEGKLSEDFVGGAYLASGTLDNPTGSNQTLTGNFSRFTVGLDRAWVTYKPKAGSWMELTGGKFAYTWNRTSLTFDPDLNPQGFSEKFTFKTKNRVLQQVSFTGMQLMFNEVAGSSSPVSSGADSYAVGGQVSGNLKFGDRVATTVSGLALNWRNIDPIAQAVAAKTLTGNRQTNATIGTGSSLRYASQFLYTDVMANTTVQTGAASYPLRILLDYVVNPRAASGNDMGYFAEAALGRTQERYDLQFGYSFARVEQDAVLAAFNESEFRAPTNVIQHRVFLSWLPQRNTTALVTGWFGRTLDRKLGNAAVPTGWPAGKTDPLTSKIQLDLIYKF